MELRGKKVRTAVLLALAGSVVCAAVAVGQQASPEGGLDAGDVITVNGQAATGGRTFTITKPGTFDEAHFKDADIRSVLRLLSTEGKRNIVASKSVTGTITADFYDVSFDEALDAIMRATGYVYQKRGDFYFVYTPKELAEIKEKETGVVRVIRLHYVRATDIQAMVKPLLGPNGTITINPSAGTGIATSSTEAGGDDYSGGDVLVVKDIEENVEKIERVVTELDIKPQQLLIEATLLRADLTEDNALGIDITSLGGGITLPNLDTSITYNTDFTGGVSEGGLSMTVTGGRAEFLIRAIEGVTDVTVMANPKLLVLNKQRGEVLIGNREGYLTTTVTETSQVQTVEFLEVGTRLVVRPYIGKDGNIRMEIHPENSSGSVNQIGSFVLPSETTTEVTSNVMVRDGHTVVIGGLFRETTTVGRSQVPLVGNVPIVGSLFRRTSDSVRREEVIILLTPHILNDEVAAGIGAQLKQDAERQRLGARKGLQWWGRARMAQTHLNWAKAHARKGEQAMALWNTDLALSMSPRMADALHMKEKLTGKAIWSDYNKISEAKYIMQRMLMEEIDQNWREIVPPNRPRKAGDLAPEVRRKRGILPRRDQDGQGPMALESLIPTEQQGQQQAEAARDGQNATPDQVADSPQPVDFGPAEIPVGEATWKDAESGEFQAKAEAQIQESDPVVFEAAKDLPERQDSPSAAPSQEPSEPQVRVGPVDPAGQEQGGNPETDRDVSFWKDLQELMPSEDIWQKLQDLEEQYGQSIPAREPGLERIDQTVRLEPEEIDPDPALEPVEVDEDELVPEPQDQP